MNLISEMKVFLNVYLMLSDVLGFIDVLPRLWGLGISQRSLIIFLILDVVSITNISGDIEMLLPLTYPIMTIGLILVFISNPTFVAPKLTTAVKSTVFPWTKLK